MSSSPKMTPLRAAVKQSLSKILELEPFTVICDWLSFRTDTVYRLYPLPVPPGMTMEQFLFKRHPIRGFLYLIVWRKLLQRPCEAVYKAHMNMIWWFKIRFVSKYKYNIVHTRLKPGYYDKDYILLHANFSIMMNYVEEELKIDGKTPLESIDEVICLNSHIALDPLNPMCILRELYVWWTIDRVKRQLVEENRDFGNPFIEEKYNVTYSPATEFSCYTMFYNEDTAMLNKLIGIRASLWT